MPAYGRGEQVRSVDIHGPELLEPLVRVLDSVEVLREAGGGDEVVDLAVRFDHLVDARVDRLWVRDVGVMCRDFRDAEWVSRIGGRQVGTEGSLLFGIRIFFYKVLDYVVGLILTFLLCRHIYQYHA